jgi:hypothetical protein
VRDPGENGTTLPEQMDSLLDQQRRVVALKQAVKTVNLAPGFAADEGELARAVLSMARLYESWLKDGANPE